ncbi:MAG: electron transfer flavoprotein subunit alpha/FixB family protein [Bordetella sp.]|nr:MAG: electron transfer flavoprotein subunit alpha/FixB family protein [Bordetella sp.]
MVTLVVAEHNNFNLKSSTFSTISAAIKLGNEIHILVIGFNILKIVKQAARIFGISKVFFIDSSHLYHPLSENFSLQIFTIAFSYNHILFPATSFGKNIAPRVAAILDVSQISEVIDIKSDNIFCRFIYTGNVIATVQSHDKIKVITICPASFESIEDYTGSAVIESIKALPNVCMSSLISYQTNINNFNDLNNADIIVAGGKGFKNAKNFKILRILAQRLKAAIGASRAAIESGYAEKSWQIGQSGKIVSPKLYIAIGISGSIQHIVGMKNSKIIVAINNDMKAPILNISDYYIIGDLLEILPKLINALSDD